MARARCYASDVLEDIRKKVEGGLGPRAKGGSEDLAGAILGKAQGAADQLSGFASAIGEWVAFAREFIRAEVRDVVDREVGQMGFAPAQAVEKLAARIERLERRIPAPASGKKPRGKSGEKGSSAEKAKRKAIAKDLDALTARVERLERGAESGTARRTKTANAGRRSPSGRAARPSGESSKPAASTARRAGAARSAASRAKAPVRSDPAPASTAGATPPSSSTTPNSSPTRGASRPASGR